MKTEKILIGEIEMNDDRAEGGKGDIESLARNMEKYGQINAVTVVEDISNPYRYRIIAGRRRIAAAESLGWAEIRADVYSADEIGEDSEEMIALSENAAREEMNAIDEGVLYAKELKKGTPVEELAALFCRNKSTVYQRAKLASLIPEMRELYKNGKMSLHVAAMASVLQEDVQKKVVERLGERSYGQISTWDVKGIVSEVSNDFLDQLGNCEACAVCSKRTRYSDRTLFPELSESNDRCLDHDCYFKKLTARIESAFNEFSKKSKGVPELDCWDGKRIVTTEKLPDGIKVLGIPLGDIADDEDDITEINDEKDVEIKQKLEDAGKIEYVPCWDGTEFIFIELAKREDIDALYYGDKGNEDEWTQKRRAELADIFQSLGEEWYKKNLSEAVEFYKLKDKVTEIFNEKMREAVFSENDAKIFVTEQIALIALLQCGIKELREIFPEAGISEDEKAYSLSVYEKLLTMKRGAMLRGILKSFLSGYRVKPGICNIDGSDWEKIFAHLDIDLKILRDEAAKETVGFGSEIKTEEPVETNTEEFSSDDYSDTDIEEWSDDSIVYEEDAE